MAYKPAEAITPPELKFMTKTDYACITQCDKFFVTLQQLTM